MTDHITASTLTLATAAAFNSTLVESGPRPGADIGNPIISQLELYSDEILRFGVWQSTPGGWKVENRVGTETCLVLSGRARVTTRGGEPVELGPGDGLVMPHGWLGRWETLETVRKVYTVSV